MPPNSAANSLLLTAGGFGQIVSKVWYRAAFPVWKGGFASRSTFFPCCQGNSAPRRPRSIWLRENSESVRQSANILDEVGRHLAGAVPAQSQGVNEPAKTSVDCIDNLIVSANRGEEMGDVIRHLTRHLAPSPLLSECIELVAEILQ